MPTKILTSNTAMGASGPNHAPGFVPDPGPTAGTTRFLREDADFVTPTAAEVTNALDLSNTGTQTMQGSLTIDGTTTLSADPAANLQAATKQYVDNKFSSGFTGSVPLAKLTTGGANGSLTVVNGLITAATDPT